MIYLTKAVDLSTNEEVFKLGIMKKYNYEGLNLCDYKLTVNDEYGNEVTDYNIEDLYGAYTDVNCCMVFLHVVDKKYFSLYRCLRYMDEQYTGYHSENDRPGRNIGCEIKGDRTDYYFFYDSVDAVIRSEEYYRGDLILNPAVMLSKSINTCTLDGIVWNTNYWEFDNDIFIVHCRYHDVIYEVTNKKDLNALLTKLKVLRRNR